jgi:cytochrome b561
MAGYKCFSVFFLKKYQAAGKQNYRIGKKYKKNRKAWTPIIQFFSLTHMLAVLLYSRIVWCYCTVVFHGTVA